MSHNAGIETMTHHTCPSNTRGWTTQCKYQTRLKSSLTYSVPLPETQPQNTRIWNQADQIRYPTHQAQMQHSKSDVIRNHVQHSGTTQTRLDHLRKLEPIQIKADATILAKHLMDKIKPTVNSGCGPGSPLWLLWFHFPTRSYNCARDCGHVV